MVSVIVSGLLSLFISCDFIRELLVKLVFSFLKFQSSEELEKAITKQRDWLIVVVKVVK